MATRKRSCGRRCTKRVRVGGEYTLIGEVELDCKEIRKLTGMSNDQIRQMVNMLNNNRINILDFDKRTIEFIKKVNRKYPIMSNSKKYLKAIVLTGCDIGSPTYNPIHTRRSISKSSSLSNGNTRSRSRN